MFGVFHPAGWRARVIVLLSRTWSSCALAGRSRTSGCTIAWRGFRLGARVLTRWRLFCVVASPVGACDLNTDLAQGHMGGHRGMLVSGRLRCWLLMGTELPRGRCNVCWEELQLRRGPHHLGDLDMRCSNHFVGVLSDGTCARPLTSQGCASRSPPATRSKARHLALERIVGLKLLRLPCDNPPRMQWS